MASLFCFFSSTPNSAPNFLTCFLPVPYLCPLRQGRPQRSRAHGAGGEGTSRCGESCGWPVSMTFRVPTSRASGAGASASATASAGGRRSQLAIRAARIGVQRRASQQNKQKENNQTNLRGEETSPRGTSARRGRGRRRPGPGGSRVRGRRCGAGDVHACGATRCRRDRRRVTSSGTTPGPGHADGVGGWGGRPRRALARVPAGTDTDTGDV